MNSPVRYFCQVNSCQFEGFSYKLNFHLGNLWHLDEHSQSLGSVFLDYDFSMVAIRVLHSCLRTLILGSHSFEMVLETLEAAEARPLTLPFPFFLFVLL